MSDFPGPKAQSPLCPSFPDVPITMREAIACIGPSGTRSGRKERCGLCPWDNGTMGRRKKRWIAQRSVPASLDDVGMPAFSGRRCVTLHAQPGPYDDWVVGLFGGFKT